jgi:hypothetical protein
MRRPHPRLFLATLAVSLVAGAAFGGDTPAKQPPTPEGQVKAAVVDKLLEQHRRRSMFSRAVLAPPRYELHVAKTRSVDGEGASFVTFEVARHTVNGIAPMPMKKMQSKAQRAQQAAAAAKRPTDEVLPLFVGCVYPETGDVYVAEVDAPETLVAADLHPQLQVGLFDLAPGEKPTTVSSFSERAAPCQSNVPVG